jgi:hypothetical protein
LGEEATAWAAAGARKAAVDLAAEEVWEADWVASLEWGEAGGHPVQQLQ